VCVIHHLGICPLQQCLEYRALCRQRTSICPIRRPLARHTSRLDPIVNSHTSRIHKNSPLPSKQSDDLVQNSTSRGKSHGNAHEPLVLFPLLIPLPAWHGPSNATEAQWPVFPLLLPRQRHAVSPPSHGPTTPYAPNHHGHQESKPEAAY